MHKCSFYSGQHEYIIVNCNYMKLLHVTDEQHKALRKLALENDLNLQEATRLVIEKGLKIATKKGAE